MEPTKQELIDCIKNFLGLLDTPLGRKRFSGEFPAECIAIGRELISRSVEYPPVVSIAETNDPLGGILTFYHTDNTTRLVQQYMQTANSDQSKSGVYVTNLDKLKISEIAELISEDWLYPNYAAAPYLEAMHSLTNITDTYYADSGKSVVIYFLANAQSWKGEIAKVIKKELKRRCNLK